MNAKTLVAALALAACGAASANSISLGAFDEDTSPLSFNHKSSSVLLADQAFIDTVSFDLTAMNDATVSLTFANNTRFKMTLDSWSLSKTGTGVVAAQPGSTFALASYTGLGAGSYELSIFGTLKQGFKGNTYGGNLVTELAPVPEPETYALMLAGLGAIGIMVRRRCSV